MVREYSIKKDGDKHLSSNFKVKEFACRDGSDKVLISDELVELLQKIRNKFGKPITINSGYRTPVYNRRCGGAPNSQHLYGTAADITISGVDPLDICRFAETLNIGGIGWYIGSNFTHVDVRSGRSRWKQIKSGQSNISVTTFFPTLRQGDKNDDVKYLQTVLNKHGYGLVADGDFGAKTFDAVKVFQWKMGLGADGIVGARTWAALEV